MTAIYQGTVLAKSDTTVVVEGNHYFPRNSVNMDLFTSNSTPYTCPWKGSAEYFDLAVDGAQVSDVAWSYPDPKPAAQTIAGHLAFDAGKGVQIGN